VNVINQGLTRIRSTTDKKFPLDEATVAELERLLRRGCWQDTAAEYAGLTPRHFTRLYNRGRDLAEQDFIHPEMQPYVDFYRRMSKASSYSEVKAQDEAFKGLNNGDPNYALKYLSTRYGIRYGPGRKQMDLKIEELVNMLGLDRVQREQLETLIERKLSGRDEFIEADYEMLEEGDLDYEEEYEAGE
jgi:hypothetical protein